MTTYRPILIRRLIVILLGLGAAPLAAGARDIELGFTGISMDIQGTEGRDYAVERLWHDRASDDDVIIYLRSDVPIALGHNERNMVGAKTPWKPGMDPGTIVWKADGDGLRDYRGNKYHAAPAMGNEIRPPLGQIQFQYDGPFTLKEFKGKVGPGEHFHWGCRGPFGDEWHVLTFWDVDPKNTRKQRDDQANDGKVVLIVLDPKTPALSFRAERPDEYYTTPAKTYYTPHIFRQKTYLSGSVRISLANITNDEPIRFQVDDGPVQTYTGPLASANLFGKADTVHDFACWLGEDGPKKVRKIHYEPSQPAGDEVHPRMLFPNPETLAAARAKVSAGGPEAKALLDPGTYIAMPDVDFRSGLRYLGEGLFRGGYYYQTKGLAAVIREHARVGQVTMDEGRLRRAADGLLFMYTIDPLGCESFDGRSGGPCQERAMYSDGRVTISVALAYDLIAGFTREAGYAKGMTAIEHIKIRDNLAGEACIMLKYPTSVPEPFWRTTRAHGSPRNVQLEMFVASLAMAMPTYDSPYYGTSGADGKTRAAHLHAPFEDAAIEWIRLNSEGHVHHPKDPGRFRHSALHNLLAEDGSHVGQPRDGYLVMMHKDVIDFLNYRLNFDGHHYPRFERYLRMRILQRYPFNGCLMPQGFYGGGYNSPDRFLAGLVHKEMADAALYRWALENPVKLDKVTPRDKSIQPEVPPFNSHVTPNYAIFSSGLGDPKAVMMRMRVFPPAYWCGSGTFQTYLGGAFNLCGYGERLAIEKAGYHRVKDYQYGTSMIRKNVVMIDGRNDPSYLQVRGRFTRSILTPVLDYAEMRTDLEAGPAAASYVKNKVNLTRRVFFVEKKFFLIVDALESGTGEHQYDWLLHGSTGGNPAPEAFTVDHNTQRAFWRKANGVSLMADFFTPVELNREKLVETDYVDGDKEGIPEPYIRARTRGQTVHYAVLLYPLNKGMAAPVTKYHRRDNSFEVLVDDVNTGGCVSLVVRTKAGPVRSTSPVGLKTDGRLALVRTCADRALEYLLVVDGTYARAEEAVMELRVGAAGSGLLARDPNGRLRTYEAADPAEAHR